MKKNSLLEQAQNNDIVQGNYQSLSVKRCWSHEVVYKKSHYSSEKGTYLSEAINWNRDENSAANLTIELRKILSLRTFLYIL